MMRGGESSCRDSLDLDRRRGLALRAQFEAAQSRRSARREAARNDDPADDSRWTVEIDDRYVILASFAAAAREGLSQSWRRLRLSKLSIFEADTNPELLGARGLQGLLASSFDMKRLGVEATRSRLLSLTSREGAMVFLPNGRQLIEDDDIAAGSRSVARRLFSPPAPRHRASFEAPCSREPWAHARQLPAPNGTSAFHGHAERWVGAPVTTVIVPAIHLRRDGNAPHSCGRESLLPMSIRNRTDAGPLISSGLAAGAPRRADAVFPCINAEQSCE